MTSNVFRSRPAAFLAVLVFLAGAAFVYFGDNARAEGSVSPSSNKMVELSALDGFVAGQTLSLIHISEPTRPY